MMVAVAVDRFCGDPLQRRYDAASPNGGHSIIDKQKQINGAHNDDMIMRT
jgi:hypothetical protein